MQINKLAELLELRKIAWNKELGKKEQPEDGIRMGQQVTQLNDC
jgi:hypothetical protein